MLSTDLARLQWHEVRKGIARGWICGLFFQMLGACNVALPPGIPVRGTIADRPVDTFVDSRAAVRYLQTGSLDAPGQTEEGTWIPVCSVESLRSSALAQLAARYSVDTAAAFAAKCLLERHAEINSAYDELVADLRAAKPGQKAIVLEALTSYRVVFVPGWNYRSARDESGADFRRQRELFSQHGVETVLVPLNESGSVEDNALVIGRTLDQLGTHRSVILISASSGGAATAHALGAPGAGAHPQVVGWLNIGGILHGMPFIDHSSGGVRRATLRAVALLQGWSMESIESMSVARSVARMASNDIPERVSIVNYVGIPLLGDVSERASFFYARMRAFGPNDGLTLITDAIAPRGHTLVALGQDHFFAADPELDMKSLALAGIILRVIEEEHSELRSAASEGAGGTIAVTSTERSGR